MANARQGLGLVPIGIACAAMSFATVAMAAGLGFSEGLSAQERSACGIARLNPPQVAALNALVEHDVVLARQGGVTGFSTAFSERHSAQERQAAGVSGLTAKERSVLDSLAARAISMGPEPMQSFSYAPPPLPPAPPESLVPAPRSAEVHGDLSFTVGGGGHGSSFYGGSADLFITDPTGTLTIGVGVSEYRGRGWGGPYGLFCTPYAGPFAPGF
jgi:hypothetical protein